MTKAVLLPLGILFLLATALSAQTNADTDRAVNRAVMAQANTILLRQKLVDARNAAARGDLAGAAKLYEDAKELVDQIGSGIEAETAQTISGLTTTRLELAHEAQSRGDLREADIQVSRVLKVDPQNAQALEFKRQNDQMMAAMKGRMPDAATLEQVPIVMSNKVYAATLVQDAKLLYEMGKFEEAQVKLRQALKLDPDNVGATYYWNIIKQAEYNREDKKRVASAQDAMVEVQAAWSPKVGIGLPVPNPYVTNRDIHTGVGREVLYRKLDTIRLDSVPDSWSDGVPLTEVIRRLALESKARDPEKRGINFIFNPNVEAGAVPTAGLGGGLGVGAPGPVNPTTGLPEPSAAGPTTPAETLDASTVNVKLVLNDISLHEALDAVVLVADHPIKYSVEDYAVVISGKPAGPEPPILEMRVFKVDPNTFYQGLQSVTAFDFGSANSSSSSSGGGSSGGSSGGGGGSSGSGSGNSISGAVVPVVDIAPGGGQLRQSSGGQGGGGGGGGGQGGQGGGILGGGGGGGGGIPGAAGGGAGGGTVFTSGGGVAYLTVPGYMQNVNQAAQAFFLAVGVNLTTPGRSIAFNDRLGLLFVKATPGELDTIERTIQALNQVAPQVHIKARFIELEQSDSTALGFQWYLGNYVNGKVIANGGSAPSLTVPVSSANPLGTFPGNTTASQVAPSVNDQLLTSGLRNPLGAPTLTTVTGILTDPNFRVAIQALEQRSGVEALAEPEAVTTSGRQTQMHATDVQFILTGFSFNSGQATTGVGATTPVTGTTVQSTPNSAITPNTQQFELGPTLDVVPYVLSDGYTINLTLLPEVLQFQGYDPVPAVPGYNPNVSQVSGGVSTLPTVLPHFTVKEIVTTVNIWDHQTVVLGGLISSTIESTKDKVPFLGDLPAVGRLFQSQAKQTVKKNLMIFVTATIVDPAGNRVHSDDELPFNPATIPAQPVVPGQTFEPNPNVGGVGSTATPSASTK